MQHIIKEDLLHYVWKTKQIDIENLTSTEGHTVTIQEWGNHNHDSGPDFFNGKVIVDGILWAGNIEMHIYSSDWEKHSHECDSAYDNVVLHVVYEEDKPIYNHEEKRIPCIELKDRIAEPLKQNYGKLLQSTYTIPCEAVIGKVDPLTVSMWKSRLIAERLEEKARYTKTFLVDYNQDWETAFYITLCRYMGARVNTEPFEALAKNLPLHILHKNKDDLHKVESLIYGVSGMLEVNYTDEYFINLKSEWKFLSKKYALSNIPPVMWKFSKMRPPNFPTVRLAQLAQILGKHPTIFAMMLDETEPTKLREIFEVTASTYWDQHYRFDTISKEERAKSLTSSFIDLILINVVSPVLFLYGLEKGQPEYGERAINLLETLTSEKNSVISKWKSLGISSDTALDSQSLIHLKSKYCDHKKCLSCNIGNKIVLL